MSTYPTRQDKELIEGFLKLKNEKEFTNFLRDLLTPAEIEGLVLKRGDSKLDSVGGREHEVSWQIRCRKPSNNYQF